MNKSEINICFEDQQPSKGFEYKGDMFYKQPYFKCNCGTNFRTRKSLRMHIQNYYKVNSYQCKCGIKLTLKKSVKSHIKRWHRDNSLEVIHFKALFPNARLQMPLPNTFYYCNATFASDIKMVEHKKIYTNGIFLVCSVVGCQQKYKNQAGARTLFNFLVT